MTSKHTRKLSPRQKRAVEALASGRAKTKKGALLAAGYPKSVAETKTGREWTPDMAGYARELLDKEGITDSFLAREHKKLFRANSPVTFEGAITAWFPDNATRKEALKIGYAVKGLLRPEVDVGQAIGIMVQSMTTVIVQFVPKGKQDAAFAAIEQNILKPVGDQH